jgi:hypothetical protein
MDVYLKLEIIASPYLGAFALIVGTVNLSTASLETEGSISDALLLKCHLVRIRST